MDVKFLFPFVISVNNVLPPLGFQSVTRDTFRPSISRMIRNRGVMVAIELFGTLRGYVIYNFNLNAARNIAEKMIAKTAIIDSADIDDEMVKSAIGELGNILAANATIILEGYGIMIDISPPKFFYGDINVPATNQIKHFVVNLKADNYEFELNTLITKK